MDTLEQHNSKLHKSDEESSEYYIKNTRDTVKDISGITRIACPVLEKIIVVLICSLTEARKT